MTPPTDDRSLEPDAAQGDPSIAGDRDEPTHPDVPDVPGWLDWLLGGFVVLAGLGVAVPGGLIFAVGDRAAVESVVAAEEFTVEGMTEPEFVDLTVAMLPWLAAGLLLTGITMIALGIAYIVRRRRTHGRAAAGGSSSAFTAHALLGAVVSVLASFIPFSPVVGGGVAGYLERGDSERTISVGAASGAVMSAPVVAISLFAAAGLVAGFATIGDGGFGWMIAGLVVVGMLFSLGFTVALGALGGWIGGRLAE